MEVVQEQICFQAKNERIRSKMCEDGRAETATRRDLITGKIP
jgi:hypothetical protein